MHILSPVTAKEYDGSHPPKYAEWHRACSSRIRPVLHDAPLSPALEKSSNGESGYYQYILLKIC